MQGYILVSNENGRRCIHVPEAHIQFYVVNGGRDRWVVCAFMTDGYHRLTRDDLIPTIQHLEHAYQKTARVEVPDHVVLFAVESVRRRQESVEHLEEILLRTIATKDKASGIRGVMSWLDTKDPSEEKIYEVTEHRIGEEINQLIEKSGGLQ